MESNEVKIGPKDLKYYFPACFFALSNSKTINILARGKNTTKALNLLAILIREYLDKPKYSIEVSSEKFDDGDGKERYVTAIDIELSGTKKEVKKQE